MSSRGSIMDKPEDSHENMIKLQVDDYIVLSTDGLFDNVSGDEIAKGERNSSKLFKVIKENENEKVEVISKKLVELAEKKSRSQTNETPFSLAARKSGYNFRGGKVDDITVIVLKVE
jgi:protein phosphatase PTC7